MHPVSERSFVADAGGLATRDGGRVRRGHLLRVSGSLVTRLDLKTLDAAGVTTYVDLRGNEDDRWRLERWAHRRRVAYHSVPIDVAGGRDLLRRIALGGSDPRHMHRLYATIVDGYGAEIATTIGLIARKTPIAFGCAVGKDRTGVVAAFTQELLGVADDDIARSYTSSAPPVDVLTSAFLEEAPNARRILRLPGARMLLGTAEATMHATLAHVRDRYGSVEEYLVDHGLAPGAVTRLREALVVT